MRELIARLVDWFRRDRLDAELREELRFHQTQLERDARATAGSADDRVWTARRRLGNATRLIEDARERWSVPWLDHLQQDVRYTIRGLRRSPGFAIPVILTLGLGLGANAAMFGVVDRLMFRPDPYLRDPASVDRVYLRVKGWSRDRPFSVFPYTRYLDLRRWATTVSQQAVFVTATVGVGSGEQARDRPVLAVSASFFDFFDARPSLGRLFVAAEDTTPVGANVAVLGWGTWQGDYGGRDVRGQSIQVGNARYTIVGVAPPRFVGISDGAAAAVFVPVTAYAANEGGPQLDYYRAYSWDVVQMIVRRRPGVSREVASADLTTAFRRSWEASRIVHPMYASLADAQPRAIAGAVKTAAGPLRSLEARTLLWVTGVAGIVLLIACANVANLFLVRAMRRQRETALRLALGVPRGRLAAQALTESLMLALIGCALGIGIAAWGGLALRRLFIDGLVTEPLADWRTLGVAAGAAVGAALVTAIAPVVVAGRADLTGTLKSGARAGTYQRSRTRTTLLVMQGGLSVLLLVGAGLFVRSVSKVRGLVLGYDVERVLLVEWERRGTVLDSVAEVGLRARMMETALARPDVERAAWTVNAPFDPGTSVMNLSIPGVDSVSRLGRFASQIVSQEYFATMRTRIIQGRSFTPEDRPGTSPVMVVSAAMADRLWPGQAALGRCIKADRRTQRPDTLPCTTVIGVAENAVHDPVADVPMRYYLPDAQAESHARTMLLRMRRDPASASEDVRRALQRVMPGTALISVSPASDRFDAKRRSWLVGAWLFTGFGGLALLVAAVGLYGVIAYAVAQRLHELGVRIALGAQTRDIAVLVLGDGTRFAIAGIAVGTAAGMAASHWVQPLLFEQSARDPLVFGAVAVLLLLVAIIASTGPAVRAARADPNSVLRAD
jgi:putative ABC transport system permease protein